MRHQRRLTTCRFVFATLVALGSAPAVFADVIAFSGLITQSPQDSGNPAQNNPALNSILSGDTYRVILDFNGSIHSPGTYTNFQPPDPCFLSSASAACFIDASAGASETSFGAISLTIAADLDGIHDDCPYWHV